jgi:hypothetical protein
MVVLSFLSPWRARYDVFAPHNTSRVCEFVRLCAHANPASPQAHVYNQYGNRIGVVALYAAEDTSAIVRPCSTLGVVSCEAHVIFCRLKGTHCWHQLVRWWRGLC